MVVHHMDGAFEPCIESPISILLTTPIVTFLNVSPRVSSAACLSLQELSSSWLIQFLLYARGATISIPPSSWHSVAYLNRGSQRVDNYITSKTVLQLRIFYNDLIRLD